MKKSLLLLIAGFAICSVSVAQTIPNAGFESWTAATGYDTPDQWGNLNSLTAAASVYTCVKGTPGSPGASYINLTSKTVFTTVAPGVAATGTINPATYKVDGGFPFTAQPQKLSGKWQYMASGADKGFISIYLTKWNTAMNIRDTVSATTQNLSGMAMSWANFNITLTYQSSVAPDTAIIILSASGAMGASPVNGSYLYIDNLSFTGSVAGVDENNNINNFTLYPNPSSENVTIEFNSASSTTIKMELLDVTGKVIKNVNANNVIGDYKYSMNTSDLAKGIYFLKVSSDKSIETKKVIVD
jgi:hypothetical protein